MLGISRFRGHADGDRFFERLVAAEVGDRHRGPQPLRTGGRHVAVQGRELDRRVAKERVLDRREPGISCVPDHLELDRAVLQRRQDRPPAAVAAGAGVGLAGFDVERQILDVLHLLPAGGVIAGGVAEQFRVESESYAHEMVLQKCGFGASRCGGTARTIRRTGRGVRRCGRPGWPKGLQQLLELLVGEQRSPPGRDPPGAQRPQRPGEPPGQQERQHRRPGD